MVSIRFVAEFPFSLWTIQPLPMHVTNLCCCCTLLLDGAWWPKILQNLRLKENHDGCDKVVPYDVKDIIPQEFFKDPDCVSPQKKKSCLMDTPEHFRSTSLQDSKIVRVENVPFPFMEVIHDDMTWLVCVVLDL